MQENSILAKIIDFIFGHKYYATIMNTRGTERCEINSSIFRTKAEAEKHKFTLNSTASFMHVETISFRSRIDYPSINK